MEEDSRATPARQLVNHIIAAFHCGPKRPHVNTTQPQSDTLIRCKDGHRYIVTVVKVD